MSTQEERLLTDKDKESLADPYWASVPFAKQLVAQDVKSYAAGVADTEARIKLLIEALEQCILAFHFTREYVGTEMLPAIEGWS